MEESDNHREIEIIIWQSIIMDRDREYNKADEIDSYLPLIWAYQSIRVGIIDSIIDDFSYPSMPV